jgi:hypothetical protein
MDGRPTDKPVELLRKWHVNMFDLQIHETTLSTPIPKPEWVPTHIAAAVDTM